MLVYASQPTVSKSLGAKTAHGKFSFPDMSCRISIEEWIVCNHRVIAFDHEQLWSGHTTLTVVATASFVAFWYLRGPSSDAGKPSLFECFHIKDVTARYPCPGGISADLRS